MNKKLWKPKPYAKTQNILPLEDGTGVLLTAYHTKNSCSLDLTQTHLIGKDGKIGKQVNYELAWEGKHLENIKNHFQWMACKAVGHCRHTCPEDPIQGECS
jgi:hypothetical protein